MNQRIERMQAGLKSPFESIARDLSLKWISSHEFTGQFAREIVGGTRLAPSGKSYPPDQYTVTINQERKTETESSSEALQNRIAEVLEGVLLEQGFEIIHQPHITLATDPTLKDDDIRVIGWHSSNPLMLVEQMSAKEESDTQSPPSGAFLVVEGREHFSLKLPLVRIGRRLDNDLVLDDPHVSRAHFQLLARNRRYMLKDLGSTSGTRINGKKVGERFLQPGDVISAGGVDLIYGEDTGGPPDVTPPYYPQDRPELRDRVTPLDLSVESVKEALEDSEDEDN